MFLSVEPDKKDGKPKRDTRSDKVLRSYILSKKIVKKFEDTCDKLGISPAMQMNKLMAKFINENK